MLSVFFELWGEIALAHRHFEKRQFPGRMNLGIHGPQTLRFGAIHDYYWICTTRHYNLETPTSPTPPCRSDTKHSKCGNKQSIYM